MLSFDSGLMRNKVNDFSFEQQICYLQIQLYILYTESQTKTCIKNITVFKNEAQEDI